MKWLIASDIHGSALYCQLLMERWQAEGADRLVLLGDLLYHGPRNDLSEAYNPKAVIDVLNERKDIILCVRGNCEAEVDQMVLRFPVMADYAVLDCGSHLLYATHGHLWNSGNPLPMAPGDALICGHTHVPACMASDGVVFLNPGSVSLPKEGSRHSYMTLQDGVFLWKDVTDGSVYRDYTWY